MSAASHRARSISAGRVGRAHGLDGSFYVTGARPRLLTQGAELTLSGRAVRVERRAGTDRRPIVRVEGIEDRGAVEALRGQELTVAADALPDLQEGEWWAAELEGCEVFDGERRIGTVTHLMELPSCEALQVQREEGEPADGGADAGVAASVGAASAPAGGGELLIPMVRDAIRHVDVGAGRIDVDMSFIEE